MWLIAIQGKRASFYCVLCCATTKLLVEGRQYPLGVVGKDHVSKWMNYEANARG